MIIRSFAGPVYNIVSSILESRPEWRNFQTGAVSRKDFGVLLDRLAPQLIEAGLPADDVHFAKRYPHSETIFVDETLRALVQKGILPCSSYNADCYLEVAADMRMHHEHGAFATYIYPEEARLLFAFADILRPRTAIFLGSYYGYWAHAAIMTICASGGRVVLVDPDENAQAVAQKNIARAGVARSVEVAITTGEAFLQRNNSTFDFVVLDAEGPRDHPDPGQRGKAVYSSLLQAVLPRMRSDGTLVCHNILFHDICDCRFFDRIIARNNDELGPFLKLVGKEFPDFTEITSTEGVGIGTRKAAA